MSSTLFAIDTMNVNNLLILFTLILGVTSQNSHDKCELITTPMCLNMPYNKTVLPNLLNHKKQEDAAMEINQFSPLVKLNCSPDLKFFLCTMYAPVCTILGRPIPPCRSLCESARKGCGKVMNNFGFHWPESMNCSKFPESDGHVLCVGKEDALGETIYNKILSLKVEKTNTSQEINGTEHTLIPNQHSQVTNDSTATPSLITPSSTHVKMTKEQFEVMSEKDLLVFNAMTLQQLQQDNVKLQGEVASLKEKIDHLSSVNEPNFKTKIPEDKKELPFKSIVDSHQFDHKVADGQLTTTTDKTDSHESHSKCEPITIPMCRDMPYNQTMMPNSFNHSTQEQAGIEIHQFWPLVEIHCSADLKFFLCAVYAPVCNASLSKPLPPCRSRCENAKMGCEKILTSYGFSWPENMVCSNYPVQGENACLV